jgi:ATP-dependent DNA helicase HFM1/MER3
VEPKDDVMENMDVLNFLDEMDDQSLKVARKVPEAFEDLEPWLFQEFGDIVEVVD